ncbi:MAG: homoserine kinase [Tissierellaceae bacterium]
MIRIRVPATSANLGPGFDALGLSLKLYNSFEIEEIEKGLIITGVDKSLANEYNLVYMSMQRAFEKIGYRPRGIKIHMDAQIPMSRGLGSSAACIIGGVMGANTLVGERLTTDEILDLATEIEGHPDNVAPALLGGLVVSIAEEGRTIYNKLDIAKGLKFVALIPDFSLSTKRAREVLPDKIAFKDGTSNLARVSMLLTALANGKFHLLEYALKDSLHQPYRGRLIPDFFDIMDKNRELGALGSYLSGAGPTIMAVVGEGDSEFTHEIKKYLGTLDNGWTVKELELDSLGSRVEKD